MPKYSVKQRNCTIIFLIQLMRRQVLSLIISVLLYLLGREAWRHDPESNRTPDGIVQSV